MRKENDISIYGQPLQPSLNFSSAYHFDSVDALIHYHQDKYASVRYCRDSTELVLELEQTFSTWHGGWPALLMGSGMSSVMLVTEALLNRDKRLVCFGSFYRKTLSLYISLVEKYGVRFTGFVDMQDYLDNGEPDANDIIFVETPSNPFLRLNDIRQLRDANPDALIMADATFQGLSNDKGALACADVVLHSCTKYIAGHNDLVAGLALFPNPELYDRVWNERSMRGGLLDNMSAYLLQRSLKTYNLRIQAALENTQKALTWLGKHSHVEAIYYPGAHQNRDQSTLFHDTHQHGGSVITFEVSGDIDIYHSISRIQTLKMAPSFGSVDSLVEIPAYMSHHGKSDEDLAKLGLSTRQIRFSLGVEPFTLIEKDLDAILSDGGGS